MGWRGWSAAAGENAGWAASRISYLNLAEINYGNSGESRKKLKYIQTDPR
jgi:hypothetical protein